MGRDIKKYIDEYSGELTRLCISLCASDADAEDLFQDTWYRAMKNFEKYNSEMPFDKWLFAICVNLYKNSLKLAYNRKRVEFKSDEEKERFLNSIPNCDDESRDKYLELHRAVASLPKKLKTVVVLYYFKSYSTKEIARMLNIPEGTVKSRMYAARERLKKELERLETEV